MVKRNNTSSWCGCKIIEPITENIIKAITDVYDEFIFSSEVYIINRCEALNPFINNTVVLRVNSMNLTICAIPRT